MNKTLLLIFLLLTPGITLASHAERANRPNIIFLLADDQRADTIGAHGNPHIQTPNLDRLAAEGFSFRRNYCAGSFSGAVCVASRAMLMTGRHWMNLPAKKPASNWGDSAVLPALLTASGKYNSFIIGKWHNGRGTLDKAFSRGRSIYMGGMANHADFQVQDLTDGKLSPKRDAGGFSSSVFADEAVKFVQTAGNEQPFFLYVAFMAPHDPRNPPEEYRQMYYKKRPPLPANFLPQHPFRNAPQATSGRDESLAPWPRTKEVISDQLCEYYGLVTHLDEQVGRILAALSRSPHAKNTIVIYTADHGLAMGSHGLLGKQNVYEQSMRCPLILSGPGVPKGKSSNALTYIHDLYSTICDFAAIETPRGVDSQSLSPIMSGQAQSVRDSLFLPFQDNQRAVRDGKWKLHVYPKINHRLLFDLSADPHEITNLATDPAHRVDLERTRALMGSWRKRLNDPYPLGVENPEPKQPEYDNSKRVLDVWQPKWIRDKYFDGRDNPNHGKIATLSLLAVSTGQTRGAESREHVIERTYTTKLTYRCIVTVPADYETDRDRSWPMILFLHGGGSPKPEQLKRTIRQLSDLPAIVVAPICPPSPDGPRFQNWNWKQLGEVVREISMKYRVDAKKRSVIGFSMGGSGAWELPSYEPELFAKSVVIAGVCHPWSLRHYPKIPVWVFVGAKDYMRKEQQETVTSAKRFGVDVVETVWKGADHGGIFRNAMSDQRMLDWLVKDQDLRLNGERAE